MAKSRERNSARELRKQGKSIKEISKFLNVSKSSVSIWCRDIILTDDQARELQNRIRTKGSYEARVRGARVQHERRVQQIKELREKGFNLIDSISKREILLIGAALYWGEGMKKEGRARIANSDPRIIKFMVDWFKYIWHIPKDQLTFQILINEIHKPRIKDVEQYWSNLLDVPSSQFTKTTFIKTKNKKSYKNFPEHYGTLIVSVRRGGDLRHKINGIISALSEKYSHV